MSASRRYAPRTFHGRSGSALVSGAAFGYRLEVTDMHGCLVHKSWHASEGEAISSMAALPWGPWDAVREGAAR